MTKGPFQGVTFWLDVTQATTLRCELRTPDRPGSFTPEAVIAQKEVLLETGQRQEVTFEFEATIQEDGYLFVCLAANPDVQVYTSTSLAPRRDDPVQRRPCGSKRGRRTDSTDGTGWQGDRHRAVFVLAAATSPEGNNLAFRVAPALNAFSPESVINGLTRPTVCPNTWAAAIDAEQATLTLHWNEPVLISRVVLTFDTDRDSPLYSVLYGNGGPMMPLCVRRFVVRDGKTHQTLASCEENHQTRCDIQLEQQCTTGCLEVQIWRPGENVPVTLVEVMVF